jgi:hypothetical protein
VLFDGKVPEPGTLAVTIEESLTIAAGFPAKVLDSGEYRADEENAKALAPIIQTKPGMPLIKGGRTRVWKRQLIHSPSGTAVQTGRNKKHPLRNSCRPGKTSCLLV